MDTSGEPPRRTSRVRKTPTKFTQDFDTLDNSPTPKAWDEQALRAFYDSVAQHGSGNWRKVAQACGRSLSMCEDLYGTHKAFLETVNSGNADAMWQYFRSGASSVLGPPAASAPAPKAGSASGLASSAEPGVNSPASNPTSVARKGGVRKAGSRTPVVPTVEPPAAGKQGGRRNTPRRSANDMTRPGMGSPNHDGGPETRAGPPTRRRRLDFSNMHESSPSLAFATGDSPYSKLDVLAAAASEAACQAQTPAVSDHSHEVQTAHGGRPHIPPVATVPPVAAPAAGTQESADAFYTPRQTSMDGGSLSHRRGAEDDGDVLNSSGGRALAAGASRKRLREHENEACNGPAIDLQQREALGNASIAPALIEGREGLQQSMDPLESEKQVAAGTRPTQPHGHALQHLSAGQHADRARVPLQGAEISTPVRPLSAGKPPQAPGSSRKSSRKSPPERLPLHLMQHRAWLMPGFAGGSNGQATAAADSTGAVSAAADLEDPERRLRHCLGLRARRWAMFEFVTPPIDRAFYEEGSMSEYLHSLGLSQIKSFSKADMSFIRRALGAPPRRFSAAFVHSERGALHAHRARCRSLYEGRTATDSSSLPAGVPAQCVVGQTVVARHPMLRTLHDGNVLTVGASTYMVQFHRSELGVGKVPDTDLAPADSLCWTPLTRADSNGGTTMGRAPSAGAHEVPQDIGDKDFGLIDKVSALLAKKAKLLEELKAINNEAQEGQHQLRDGCFEKSFHVKYAKKVAEFKAVNSELVGSCTALKSRVDEVSSLQGLMSRNAAAARPLTGEDDISQAATAIVQESMTEAATLVHNLFQQHHQKRSSEAPASGSAAPGPPTETTEPGKLPASSGAQENGAQGARKSGAEQEPSAVRTPPETTAACATLPVVKQEAQVTTASLRTTPRGSQSPPAAAENPSSLALLVDDESLMHMSTKLTAMFIAIQRCAASCQDARTVQRALIKLVADLKPASSRNSAQYELITKNVGRLSVHLGAR